MIRISALCTIFSVFCVSAFGDEPSQFTHARFADTDTPLASLIKFPGARKDADVKMRCDAVVTDAAELNRVVCYGPDRYKMSYKNAVYDVIEDVAFVSATVNGETKTVIMQFTVHFVRRDGVENIYIYPNHGHDADKYGPDYIGVQRYDWGMWSSHACRGHHRRYHVNTRATIGPDGSYQDHKLIKGDMVLGPCEEDINKHIKTGSYIPAMNDGVAVESRFVETFLNFLDPKVSY
ncbi:MAG: hypothetical protein ACE5FV_09495 [Woeseia sp.]